MKKIMIIVALGIIGLVGYKVIRNMDIFKIRRMMVEDKEILESGRIISEKRSCNLKASHRIESLAAEIMNWKESDSKENSTSQTFPWEDVALSLLRYPEDVKFEYDTCPDCGNERIELYFHSPQWTWVRMCGQAGDMVICPHCKHQASFECNAMN